MPDHRFTILSTGSVSPDKFQSTENGNLRSLAPIEVVPFIKIVLNSDENTRNEILALASHPLTALFTSANAVEAVTAVLHTVPDWKIYCVGNVTKKRIVSFFGESAVLGEAGNAEDLALRIIQQNKVKELFFFCGDQRRDVLPRKLTEHGIDLQELVLYRTLHTPVKLTKIPDAVLFFSPSAVTSFFSLNRLSCRTVLFALGETTAAALRAVSENQIFLSPKPDKESLIQMAVEYGRSHPIS